MKLLAILAAWSAVFPALAQSQYHRITTVGINARVWKQADCNIRLKTYAKVASQPSYNTGTPENTQTRDSIIAACASQGYVVFINDGERLIAAFATGSVPP